MIQIKQSEYKCKAIINKRVREEKVQTQIYTGLTTPLCLRPVPKQPA